jgi:hypothetical protein
MGTMFTIKNWNIEKKNRYGGETLHAGGAKGGVFYGGEDWGVV